MILLQLFEKLFNRVETPSVCIAVIKRDNLERAVSQRVVPVSYIKEQNGVLLICVEETALLSEAYEDIK